MFKGVLFDMDGVVADSEPLHIKAENETLAPYNIQVTEEDYKKFLGRSSKLLLKSLVEKYSINVNMERLFSIHKENLLHLYRKEVNPIKGSLELIKWFYQQNYSLALASSSNSQLVESVIKKFRIEAFFKAIVSGSEVEYLKPAPDIFLKALQQLSLKAEECLVIEDSTAGVEAAKSAGMYCVGFRSPHTPGQNFNQADLIIDDLTHLLSKLKKHTLEKIIYPPKEDKI